MLNSIGSSAVSHWEMTISGVNDDSHELILPPAVVQSGLEGVGMDEVHLGADDDKSLEQGMCIEESPYL